jgi:hypothetical protein
MKIFLARLTSVGAIACLATLASAQVTLYDTGPHAVCLFNGAASNLGWTSGNVSAAQPQRWAAQPFTLPAGNWHITQIAPEWFTGTGVNTSLGFKIWHRVGQVAPAVADEAVSGSAAVVLDNDPITTDFVLAGGDYYLSVFSASAQGNTIGWFTNAQSGIHFIDPINLVPFMYRGTTYPPPSWVMYELAPAVLAPSGGSDPNKLYCAAFKIIGEAAPVTYCTAGTSELPSGCTPTIGSIGYPHVSQPLGFTVQVSNMPVGRSGIIFYSLLGRAQVQWGTGTSSFCMLTPVQRMNLLTSVGTSTCDGVMGQDWLTYLAANPGASGNPFAAGTVVQAQGWYRDPGASKNTNLSDAIEWTCLP